MIKMIFAIARSSNQEELNFAFGLNNGLPWPKNKEDFQHFQDYTKDCVICCSQKTADTLPKSVYTTLGRSLFILERKHTAHDLPENAVIIGGAKIIEDWYQCCDEISVTFIDGRYDHDVVLNNEVWHNTSYYMKLKKEIKLNEYSTAFIYGAK